MAEMATVTAASLSSSLARQYAEARQEERRRLASSIIERLAEQANTGQIDSRDEMARAFDTLVVSDTVHQQFAGKLAVRLAMMPEHSELLAERVREPLIDALQRALRVGAPAIRDAVVEGLGGLLKFHSDPVARFTTPKRDVNRVEAEFDADYSRRFERHRVMVLAVAGHKDSQKALFYELDAPLVALYADEESTPVPKIESHFRARADLLRTLTGLCRQAANPNAMMARAIAYLVAAANPLRVNDQAPAEVHAAVARFEESTFRTIEVLIARGADAVRFDDALANAVVALPRTVAGTPALCNAQIRATVAVLSAAAALVARIEHSETQNCLATLFADLDAPESPWTNPGILEGCLGALPVLLARRRLLTERPLKSLFDALRRPHRMDDFLLTHRQLVAHAAFRRILITVAERDDAEEALRALLQTPTAALVLAVFSTPAQTGRAWSASHRGFDAMLLSATSFERELLDRGPSFFHQWNQWSSPDKLLLTRILAMQLQASWRDARDLEHAPSLRYVYEQLPTVAVSEEARRRRIRELLSVLPAEAAGSLDADLQDFVAECGVHAGEELPGHVLAMIDSTASPRIAATVAREIELNLRRAQLEDPQFEFAKLLYQVMLRGPDASIFEHLLPRLDDAADVRLVNVFKKQVTNVRDCGPFQQLRTHVFEILEDLEEWQTSDQKTLQKLQHALLLYKRLAEDDVTLWAALVEEPMLAKGGGIFAELLRTLDELAVETHSGVRTAGVAGGAAHSGQRVLLEPGCHKWLVALQTNVAHYLELRVHEFDDRSETLARAIEATSEMEKFLVEQAGLQPPEQILLVELLRNLREVFEHTVAWYCDGPRRCTDPEAFWGWYASEPDSPQCAEKILRAGENAKHDPPDIADRLTRTRPSAANRPPSVKYQHLGFQHYFVEWMSSELDVDRMRWALTERWSRFFQTGYTVITTWWLTAIFVAFPYLAAFVLHECHLHAIEGLAFALFALGGIFVAFTYLNWYIGRRSRRDAARGKGPRFRFDALLPRLLKLIVVPLVLIVDFEHSYEFPMNASNAVLFLLVAVAFISTRFVAAREIVSGHSHSRATKSRRKEGARVMQVVSVAGAQAFLVALLFSIIFSSNHIEQIHVPHVLETLAKNAKHAPMAGPWYVRLVDRFDEIPEGHQRWPLLWGAIPREARFDLDALTKMFGWELNTRVAPHLHFIFYPPLILAWTAMGLFFGVFLEGFLKGERLRGEIESEQA